MSAAPRQCLPKPGGLPEVFQDLAAEYPGLSIEGMALDKDASWLILDGNNKRLISVR